MATFFMDLFTLPGPVADQDKALHLAYLQALADSALLEHTCKAAMYLTQVWEPPAVRCIVASAATETATAATAAGVAVVAAAAAAAPPLAGRGHGRSSRRGATSAVVAVAARLRPGALGCCGLGAPPAGATQDSLWANMTLLLVGLEKVRTRLAGQGGEGSHVTAVCMGWDVKGSFLSPARPHRYLPGSEICGT